MNSRLPTEQYRVLAKVYIDLETTGLNPGEHVVLSLAFIHEDQYGTTETLDLVIKPTELEWSRAHPRALEVNGMTWEFLEEHGIPLNEARDEVYAFVVRKKIKTTRAIIIGQNPDFDVKFLKHFFPNLQWLGFPYESVFDNIKYAKTLARYDLTFVPEGYSTHKLSRSLGVLEEDQVHTALGGAKAVMRNYKALRKRTDEVFDKMRIAAMKGDQHPDEFPEVKLVEHSTLLSFSIAADTAGWSLERGATEGHVFVDPDGARWLWAGYYPYFLIKLTK